jgi:hypothetical protein
VLLALKFYGSTLLEKIPGENPDMYTMVSKKGTFNGDV